MTTVVTVTKRFRGTVDKTAAASLVQPPLVQGNTGGGVTMDQVNTALVNRKPLHGFERNLNNVIAFDDLTTTFTITGTNFGVWFKGVQYIKNTESKVISVTNGVPSMWFIYYDNEQVLTIEEDIWDIFESIFVAILLWNGSEGTLIDRRHPAYTDWDDSQVLKQPMRIAFTNTQVPTLTSYQTIYQPIFGDDPTISLILENTDRVGERYESMQRPQFTYDSSDLLDTVYFELDGEYSGYILIK